jgi:hypothetical protein
MRRLPFCAGILIAFVGLAACGGNPPPTTATQTVAPNVLNWDRAPNAVIFRLDRLVENESEIQRANRLPACTIFGDGHVVWVDTIPPNGEQVLEVYASEVALRIFYEYLIRDQQFYTLIDSAAQTLPATADATMEVITLNLSNSGETSAQPRTVRSYSGWINESSGDPQENVYLALLARCKKLSDTVAIYAPAGAWVRAYPVERTAEAIVITWPQLAPFRLSKAANNSQAIWATGPTLQMLWQNQRQTLGQVQWLEDDNAYRVVIQVPNISRDAPPAPNQ